MKMLNDLYKRFRKNKKAQIGGTLTWFVATIIIVFILLVAVYAASMLGKAKSLNSGSGKVEKENQEEWVSVKNSLAFEKNSSNQNKIEEWLNNKTLEEGS